MRSGFQWSSTRIIGGKRGPRAAVVLIRSDGVHRCESHWVGSAQQDWEQHLLLESFIVDSIRGGSGYPFHISAISRNQIRLAGLEEKAIKKPLIEQLYNLLIFIPFTYFANSLMYNVVATSYLTSYSRRVGYNGDGSSEKYHASNDLIVFEWLTTDVDRQTLSRKHSTRLDESGNRVLPHCYELDSRFYNYNKVPNSI